MAVAVAMGVANVAAYGLSLLASRRLGPEGFGPLGALLAMIVIGNVTALGLQACSSRQVALARRSRSGPDGLLVPALLLLGAGAAALTSALALCLVPVVTRLLHLSSPLPAVAMALTLAPLTMLGVLLGVLQGRDDRRRLAALYLVAGVGKVGCASLALLLWPGVGAAVAGTGVGAALAVAFGCVLVGRPERARFTAALGELRARRLDRDTWRATHALLAFFVLANVDVVLARHFLDPDAAGHYAAGAVISKATLMLPQFVVVLAFPSLVERGPRRDRVLGRALALVGGTGLVVTLGCFVLGDLVAATLGGPAYADLAGIAWCFAALGTFLALAQLLLYDRLARGDRGTTRVVWAAVALELVIAQAWHPGPVALVVAATIGALTCLAAGATGTVLGGRSARPEASSTAEPAQQGAG